MREMRIWPQYAAKYCKNAGKFFPDVVINSPTLNAKKYAPTTKN